MLASATLATFRLAPRGLRWLYDRAFRRQPPPDPAHVSPSGTNATRAPPISAEKYAAGVDRIAAKLPYRRTQFVLTRGERAFWEPLRLAVGESFLILCKVRLWDVAAVPDHRADSHRRFHDVDGFHVDFVLCDRMTTEPLLVLELDDRSHGETKNVHSDRFKDAVLKAAGLPVYRVACQQAYAPSELREEIDRRIPRRRR